MSPLRREKLFEKRHMPLLMLRKILLVFAILLIVLQSSPALCANDEDCLDCHGERDFVAERNGKEVSLYINGKVFADSIHGDNGCVSCHKDADVEDFPHEEGLAREV